MGAQSSHVCPVNSFDSFGINICTSGRRSALTSGSDDEITFRDTDTNELIHVEMMSSVVGSCPVRARYGSGRNNPMTRPRISLATDDSSSKFGKGKRAKSHASTHYQGDETHIDPHKVVLDWPESYRWQPRHWFLIVTKHDRKQYLLQIAANLDDRTREKVQEDIKDMEGVQTLASKFNMQIGENAGTRVLVCTPKPVEILQSHLPALLGISDVGLLIPYPGKLADIEKFVFDGRTDTFVDLPSAFFHYAMFITQGKQMVVDLQGEVTDDGDLLLIDPVLVQPATADPRIFCGVIPGGLNSKAFETLHPRCTPMCNMFDPHRKVKMQNNICGGCDIQVKDLTKNFGY